MSDDAIRALCERVLAGDVRAIARAARLVDDRDPRLFALMKELHPRAGRAYVLGVTGAPGSGKSTLVDRLIEAHRKAGKKVGVVAVDPTSPYTGGAILGDRIRMQQHFLDPGVFIRSVATRGHLGGLSRSVGDIIRVLDAAGFEVVIVETVGVGQDELEVARLAHTTLVVMAPGAGDDIQAIKAGILEVADVFAVNKADRDGADATVADLEQMVHLGGLLSGTPAKGPGRGHSAAAAVRSAAAPDDGTWSPPVLKTIASAGDGVDALVAACERHHAHLMGTEEGARQRARQAREELLALFRIALLAEAERRLGDELESALDGSAEGGDPYTLAEALVRRVLD